MFHIAYQTDICSCPDWLHILWGKCCGIDTVNRVYFFICSVVFSLVTRVTYTSKIRVLSSASPKANTSIYLFKFTAILTQMVSIVTFGTYLLEDEGTGHFSCISSSFVYFLFQKCIFRSFASFETCHCYYYHSFFVKLVGAYVILDISS